MISLYYMYVYIYILRRIVQIYSIREVYKKKIRYKKLLFIITVFAGELLL